MIDTEGFSSCKRRERLILRETEQTDTERDLKIDSMTLVIRWEVKDSTVRCYSKIIHVIGK